MSQNLFNKDEKSVLLHFGTGFAVYVALVTNRNTA